MEEAKVQGILDPETEFLASKRQTGNEWELFKENVRPLKRGRKVDALNEGLKSQSDNHLRKSLNEKRRQLIKAIDDYEGDDPLQPWLEQLRKKWGGETENLVDIELLLFDPGSDGSTVLAVHKLSWCIKWVQEAFPPGGDCSGLVVIYEQCVRTFWHSDQYKDDLRYLKVWLEYAEHCMDAEVIYDFLDANEIGKSHAIYYISYALHVESKHKVKAANEILNRGISRNAQPIKKLEDVYRKFLARSMRAPLVQDEEKVESHLPERSFGTILAKGENARRMAESSNMAKRKQNADRAPFAIYKDANADISLAHQPDILKKGLNTWQNLGSRAERNKENNALPSRWTSLKIPQRPGQLIGTTTTAPIIEVFVDEECAETGKVREKSSNVQLRQVDGKELKKETELLRENPLRNFPASRPPR
ncbi:hypothetical protein CDL15_Pgr007172 [Punica granatum]|uniref:BUB1 N-terminal domain-containing protein n=1 Tax=Punica granatum TaxID=22663 RepID=A0A218X9F4_PUNGR|nr:hypothetical protein CDL15_Pgr007172 [Punica granatum]